MQWLTVPLVPTPDEITIAVTVFNRRRFLKQALMSALRQTIPARVIVVEDCGPDPTLQSAITSEFGTQLTYFRNPRRRGLFGNLNTCIALCKTRWLSILHDDDYLTPNFVEAMLELQRELPNCGLYFGGTTVVNERGEQLFEWPLPPSRQTCSAVTLQDVKWDTPFAFPGHLLDVEKARTLGGFRETSQYCGDWELWSKLVARYGGAFTQKIVAFSREYGGCERAVNEVIRLGREYPLNYIQVKRGLHLLRQHGACEELDRVAYQKRRPVPMRFLLCHGRNFSPRLRRYHWRLLLLSSPPHAAYALFQIAARLCGSQFLFWSSRLWNCLHRGVNPSRLPSQKFPCA